MAMQFDRDRLEKALGRLGRGELDRRGFLMAAGAAGITAAAAETMLFAGTAYAQSTRVAAPKAAADYIVIGAGSGGAAVAGRLSMLTDASVLVLEGGIDDRTPILADDISNPGKWPLALASPFTRLYETTPQKHAENRVVAYPRGEGLGGCSSVNCMIYNRGAAADYDTWAYEGAEGWDWKSVLSAYKEMEDWQDGASAVRGAGGPLHVTRPDPKLGHPGAHAFINGAVSLGYPETYDFNSGQLEGPAWVNFTVYGGKRQSSAVAFLRPAMEKRRNLTVLTEAPALNLVIEKGRCVGVRYLHNGKPVTVRANKEVILAAGAIATPQLLMLSGIGDPAALKALGVTPVVDLTGVGQNLQDHVLGAGVNYEAKGPLPPSNYNSSEVYMWWKSDSAQPVPDISSLFISLPFATPEMHMSKAASYSICSGVMRPKSRGSVTLNSTDPHAKPLIDPNYLAVDQDLRALKAATDISRAIGESDAYKDIRKGEVIPGALANDPVAYRDFLRKSVSTFFHPVGTTKMGTDSTSVVDAKLRVYGIEGLRVADASVMPSITTGNTNAPTMMIGWRAAAMIAAG